MALHIELWPPVPAGAHEILPDRKCPRCGGTKTHRSRIRGGIEGGMKILTPLRPFTCSECRWRGWRVPVASVGPRNELPPSPPEGRRRARGGAAAHSRHAPKDIVKRRARFQVALTVLLAVGVAVGMIRCQESEVVPSASP